MTGTALAGVAVQADALRTAAAFIEREGTSGLTVTVSASAEIRITTGPRLFPLIMLAVAAGAPAPFPDRASGRWRTAGHLGRHRLDIITTSSTALEGELS